KLGVYLLPLSGLFMSMVYPTLNSKGISCFPKHRHGAIAGVLLFFTALAAALGPLAMALMGDYGGDVRFGFYLAAAFALGLFALMAYNLWANPTAARLAAAQQGQD
ncbi:MAG TPA: MFS transporter, partial [Cellvibrionaceae bacterium]|nr:MFS transporter [Cellvibrionaceae bacterium]